MSSKLRLLTRKRCFHKSEALRSRFHFFQCGTCRWLRRFGPTKTVFAIFTLDRTASERKIYPIMNRSAPKEALYAAMQTLPRSERIRGKNAVSKLFDNGSNGSYGNILVKAVPNPDNTTRIAAIAGKKLGNAVARNKMKRKIRAAFRQQKTSLPQGWDLAIIARKGLLKSEWQNIIRDLQKAAEYAISAANKINA